MILLYNILIYLLKIKPTTSWYAILIYKMMYPGPFTYQLQNRVMQILNNFTILVTNDVRSRRLESGRFSAQICFYAPLRVIINLINP